MLLTRVVTALVLASAVLAGLFLLPPRWWALALLVVVALAAAEWARLAVRSALGRWLFVAGVVGAGLALVFAPAAGFAGGWPAGVVVAVCGAATLFWLLVAPPWLATRWQPAAALPLLLTGLVVLLGTFVALVELQSRSPWLALAAMAVVWIADTAAYFAGRAFGRRKLAPMISPGKTWEGVYGALAAVALYALALTPLAARAGFAEAPGVVGHGRLRRVHAAAGGAVGRGRPVRIDAEAAGRRQGQRRAAAGPRRRARPHRRAARGAAAGRAGRDAGGTGSAAMSEVRVVSLLGATGSIGDSTLDVIARHPDRYAVGALAAHRQWEKLAVLCERFRPEVAALLDVDAARALERALAGRGLPTRVLAGEEGVCVAATLPAADTVLAAIVGAAGLAPTLAAARAGKRILLANKEALVIGGAVFMAAVAEGGATLLPIDSEHNAIFQCLPPGYDRRPDAAGVRRILLTASGGPFRSRDPAELGGVSPAEACAHPNWSMGRKISVDSATMMNKGLEVIEAHWLFGVSPDRIEVVIHPQSVIHSLVEYVDGSVLAQLGHPDMRTPIAQALAYPARIDAGVPPLDLIARAGLDFSAPDAARFPCLRPGVRGARRGRHGARRAERGQRSRRGGVSRRPRALHRHRRPPAPTRWRASRACRCARSMTRWRPMRRPAPPRAPSSTFPPTPDATPDGSRHQDSVVPVRARRPGRDPRTGPLPRRPLVRRQDRPLLGGLRPGASGRAGSGPTAPSGRCRRCRWAATSRWPTSARATSRPADLARAFNRQSVWKRIAIVAAGPVANLLLAVALFAGTFVAGIPGQKALLAQPPAGSAAAVAGLAAGDVVVAVDGVPVSSWQDLRWRLLKASGRDDAAVEVERPGGIGGDPAAAAVGARRDRLGRALHFGARAQARFGPAADRPGGRRQAGRAGRTAGRATASSPSTTRRSGRRPTSRPRPTARRAANSCSGSSAPARCSRFRW